METYGKRDIEFVRGEGCYLINKENEKFLDFGSGIAVNSLGHCHHKLVSVLKNQASKLWHTSNLYFSSEQENYAKLICQNSFADKVFFTNSGSESIECGIKVIRNYHYNNKNFLKKNIITFEGSFHGRTFAALSASKNLKYTKGYEPLLNNFINIPFNDEGLLKNNINEKTAAILLEPIQGEGGIIPADLSYLNFVNKICKENDILLFLDEVQSGFGRSGKLFAHEWANIKPDIVATAKGIGSGFPLGACLTTNRASIGMTKGSHGSTYGGNPLAIAVGRAVLEIIINDNFLKSVDEISRYFWTKLKLLENQIEQIIEVRGAGLMLGIKTMQNNIEVCKALRQNKLLTVPAGDNIIRLLPPLIINKSEIDKATNIIEKTLK
tara:strand:- start:1332 stop:2474 length:1143 start_codon:yes stop_codon:yes gene_type:complete